MEYRSLGKTDSRVSAICLGAMTFGEQNDAAESHALMDAAFAEGVNFIDAAEMYPVPARAETYGRTETIIGEWLRKRPRRDDVIIATKIAGPSHADSANSPPPLSWIRGGKTRFVREHIAAAVEGSLRRLQTDYIDLYQLHWPDRNTNYFGDANYRHAEKEEEEQITPIYTTLAALAALQKEGKIRHVGVSNETPWGLNACINWAYAAGRPQVVSAQNPYSLLNRTYEIGMAEISAREKCGLLPYSPLAFGVLSGKYLNGARPAGARLTLFPFYKRYLSEKAESAVRDYAALAKKRGLSLAQMAIAFTIRQPFVTSSIIGATTLPQLRENIAAVDVDVDDDLRRELDDLSAKHFNPCP